MTQSAGGTLLVIEDSAPVAHLLRQGLTKAGYVVDVAPTGAEARARLAAGPDPAAVLLDIMLPDADGVDLLREFRAASPDRPVIMLTGFATVERAVECMKAGAYDFLTKPVDMTRLEITVAHALEHRTLERKVHAYEAEQERRAGFGLLVGQSAPMQALYTVVQNVAPSDASVLITGETGTGKELVALALHRASHRAAGPFVTVNCGALPRELVESELFGHEKGAFTGADRRVIGKCEQADGGTLFLDEVGEVPLELQPKLLRFLQNHEVQRLGGGRPTTVDVRVIAATNRDPSAAVRDGSMREDLYYRLNVVPVHVPPLRDRADDIPLLIEAFLDEFNTRYRKEFTAFDDRAMTALMAHPWPGNVRELRSVVERIVVLGAGGAIHVDALPAELRGEGQPRPAAAAPAPATSTQARRISRELKPLPELEREAIEKAYELCEGNVSLMAERLHMSVATIYRRLKEYERERADRTRAQTGPS